MTGSSFVRSIAVSAFETRIVAKGFLDTGTAASLCEAARAHGESSDRVVIALSGVTGHDGAGIRELERIVDDALEGGWGLALESAPQELRDACAVRLPFI